jgi:hypothetical protein
MTPEDLVVRLKGMQARAEQLPATMAMAAGSRASRMAIPGVVVRASQTKAGVRVSVRRVAPRGLHARSKARVVTVPPRVALRAALPALRKAMRAAVKGALRA